MKKLLVISYFFPPSSKAGAHRPYSMAECLPEFGWSPVFIAPEKGYFGRIPRYDDSLLEIIKQFPVKRIPHFYPFNNSSTHITARAARRLWEMFAIPDGKICWNRGIKKEIEKIVLYHKPNALFITATPFSSFLLAPYLKRRYSLPIILDYRDPFSGFPLVHDIPFKKNVNFVLEKKAVAAADLITTASYHMIDFIKKQLGVIAQKKPFFGFPYGYNAKLFQRLESSESDVDQPELSEATFAGFLHGDLDPRNILKGIKIALEIEKNLAMRFKVNCYGTVFGLSDSPEKIIREFGLENVVFHHPFLKYDDYLEILKRSEFLFLPLGSGPVSRVLYPTKFFDYLGVKKPILYVGSNSQVSETIQQCRAGICSNPEPNDIAQAIISLMERKSQPWYSNEVPYKKLSRFNIFSDFTNQLDRLIR